MSERRSSRLDLVPDGLKKAVAPKLVGKEGRGFVKVLLNELEGALERAADKIEDTEESAAALPTTASLRPRPNWQSVAMIPAFCAL